LGHEQSEASELIKSLARRYIDVHKKVARYDNFFIWCWL